jgi:hypothetical protein
MLKKVVGVEGCSCGHVVAEVSVSEIEESR